MKKSETATNLAAKASTCDVCKRRSKTTPPVHFCPHCEDHLCDECNEHHGASRSTSHHHVNSVEDFRQLPTYVNTVKHRCELHKLEHEFYCTTHGVPCCVDCTKDTHNSCGELTPLHDIVQNVKSSNEMHEKEKHISDIIENIVKLTKDRQDNVEKLHSQKEKLSTNIANLRKSINDHLDRIENATIGEINKSHDMSTSQIENLIARLEDRKAKASAVYDELLSMKTYASDLQNFIGMRELENRIKEEGKALQTLQEDENFYQSDINVTFHDIVASFQSAIPNFAEVILETGPRNVNLSVGKRSKSSNVLLQRTPSIDRVKLKLTNKIQLKNTRGFDISGCEILDEGQLLFVDRKHQKLLSCNSDATNSRIVIDFQGTGPFDVTCVDGKTAAVSLASSRSVAMAEHTTGKIVKRLTINTECFGIDHKEKKLLIRLANEGVFALTDLNGKVISRVKFEADRLRYFAFFMDKIYCTLTGQNSVVCMNMKGLEIWKYQNVLLRDPCGISVDQNGFVYVAGRASNSIMIISPDGRNSRALLTERDGLSKPQVVHVNKFRRQLLVCNRYDGMAFLFSI